MVSSFFEKYYWKIWQASIIITATDMFNWELFNFLHFDFFKFHNGILSIFKIFNISYSISFISIFLNFIMEYCQFSKFSTIIIPFISIFIFKILNFNLITQWHIIFMVYTKDYKRKGDSSGGVEISLGI